MAQTPKQRQLREDIQNGLNETRTRTWSWFKIEIIVPILFVGTVVLALLVTMGEASRPQHIKYTTVVGFFKQDDHATDPKTFDYTTTNFGLIDRAYDTDPDFDPDRSKTQWQRFENQVTQFNKDSDQKVQFKILYMGRHGEGYHNVAESYYGTAAWDCYWSLKDGNGTITWADAHLTSVGIAQAQKNNDFWKKLISEQQITTPERYYTSPLTRCLQTADVTFSGLSLPSEHPFIPEIKELFREAIGVHTCDRRSSKTYIHKSFPSYTFEAGFKENDELWDARLRETDPAMDIRTKTVLDDVFSHDSSTFISVTAHSGEIGSLLRVLGHRTFGLGTGQMIPVLVRAEVVDGEDPSPKSAPYVTVTPCSTPPPAPTVAMTF